MASPLEILKEIITLTDRVGGLKESVDKLWSKVEDHHDRIIKLEQREELLTEKMRNAAVEGVQRMTMEYFNRLAAVEQKVTTSLAPANKQLST